MQQLYELGEIAMNRASVERGIGGASLFPAGLVGLAGLTDGVGPTGWRGIAELFGWFTTCTVATLFATLLLAWGGRIGAAAYALALAIVVAMGALTYKLLDWICLDAPMPAKILFTSSLQIIGSVSSAACAVWAFYAVWRAPRR